MALPAVKPPLIKQSWLRAIIFALIYYGCLLLVSAMGLPSFIVINSITGIVLVVVFRQFIERRKTDFQNLFRKGDEGEILTGFLVGMAIMGLGALILYLHGNLLWIDSAFNASDFFNGLGLMLLVAAGEEIVFRGYVLPNLMGSFNQWVALGGSALIFAAFHASNPGINVLAIINILLGGLLLGINYLYTRNIWFAVGLHFAWNFFQGPVLGYQVSGIGLKSILQQQLTGPKMFTGGDFGFEGSIVATGLSILALLILYWLYERKYGS